MWPKQAEYVAKSLAEAEELHVLWGITNVEDSLEMGPRKATCGTDSPRNNSVTKTKSSFSLLFFQGKLFLSFGFL